MVGEKDTLIEEKDTLVGEKDTLIEEFEGDRVHVLPSLFSLFIYSMLLP